jgi:hypothetical protein
MKLMATIHLITSTFISSIFAKMKIRVSFNSLDNAAKSVSSGEWVSSALVMAAAGSSASL